MLSPAWWLGMPAATPRLHDAAERMLFERSILVLFSVVLSLAMVDAAFLTRMCASALGSLLISWPIMSVVVVLAGFYPSDASIPHWASNVMLAAALGVFVHISSVELEPRALELPAITTARKLVIVYVLMAASAVTGLHITCLPALRSMWTAIRLFLAIVGTAIVAHTAIVARTLRLEVTNPAPTAEADDLIGAFAPGTPGWYWYAHGAAYVILATAATPRVRLAFARMSRLSALTVSLRPILRRCPSRRPFRRPDRHPSIPAFTWQVPLDALSAAGFDTIDGAISEARRTPSSWPGSDARRLAEAEAEAEAEAGDGEGPDAGTCASEAAGAVAGAGAGVEMEAVSVNALRRLDDGRRTAGALEEVGSEASDAGHVSDAFSWGDYAHGWEREWQESREDESQREREEAWHSDFIFANLGLPQFHQSRSLALAPGAIGHSLMVARILRECKLAEAETEERRSMPPAQVSEPVTQRPPAAVPITSSC